MFSIKTTQQDISKRVIKQEHWTSQNMNIGTKFKCTMKVFSTKHNKIAFKKNSASIGTILQCTVQ